MDTQASNDSPEEPKKRTLQDLAVRYDMALMAKQAEEDFDIKIATRELIDQKSIGNLFNLKEKLNARN